MNRICVVIVACTLLGVVTVSAAHGATLVVANKSEATVSLVALEDLRVVATLPTGNGPHEVAVSPDGRHALVSDYGTDAEPGHSLTLIDIVDAAAMATIELPPNSRPHGLEWLDDSHAVVTAEGRRSLLVIDVDAEALLYEVATDQEGTHMLALSANQRQAFTTNIGSGTLTVVDLLARKKRVDIDTGEGAEGIALVGESEIWVTNRAAGTVSIIDTNTLETLATLDLPGFPIRVEADNGRARVYITLARADALVVMGVAERRVLERLDFDVSAARPEKTLLSDLIPDSSIPVGVLLSGDGKWLFVAHTNAHLITLWDAATLEYQGDLSVGREPDGMAWSPVVVNQP